ncbi:cytochrome c oxidase assembly protein [Vineibacter terrae]|uniref:cytochrome c oxidase assembly protein n=1 Tax=Vineibacter terrae TaxID=2586908 RepID=UPI002E36455D|nr:cytochrome c oxidase assembly protein [Vineibacter terrae]HEX2890186.1 cytochrome c oxidase assembly protein [Vineibacter terrae]
MSTDDIDRAALARRNRRVVLGAFGAVAGMVGMAYAAVPLYDMFCRATGFGGTTQVAAVAPGRVLERKVTVRFDASRDGNLPWKFEPLQREVKVRLGEEMLVFYRATNVSQRPIVGTATYNVTPDIAGAWFNKIQCFCFTEQLLMPGESVEMPVTFFVDPDMAKDHKYDGVKTITLSYTFFEAKTDRAKSLLEKALAPASPGVGQAPAGDGPGDKRKGG